jgi:hypothetical protein
MGGSGGIPVPTCACDPAVPDDGTLIQSFESRELGVLPFDDRTGVFYPFQGSDLEFECTGDPQNCVALCIRGELDGGGYPIAGIGFNFRSDGAMSETYDASAYAGVRFKIKASAPSNAAIRVDVPTVDTQPPTFGGTCDDTVYGCYDHFKTELWTDPDVWETHDVYFVNLGQGSGQGPWSEPYDGNVSVGFDPSALLNFDWLVASRDETVSNEPYELCIDDVELIPVVYREEIDVWDFEDPFVPQVEVFGGSTSPSLAQDCDIDAPAGGCALAATFAPGVPIDPDCAGFPVDCEVDSAAECEASGLCTWDATYQVCDATPGCYGLPSSECTAHSGCYHTKGANFGLRNPDIQPGDVLALWMRLPQGDIDFMNVYVADFYFDWLAFPVWLPAKRDEWIYAEFPIPDFVGPAQQLGFQPVLAADFEGTFAYDDIVIYRP